MISTTVYNATDADKNRITRIFTGAGLPVDVADMVDTDHGRYLCFGFPTRAQRDVAEEILVAEGYKY